MAKKTVNFFLMLVSCFLCSAAVNWVAVPNGFTVPGTTGLALLIEKFSGVSYNIWYYVITLIILFITGITLGKMEVRNILLLSIMFPTVLWVMNFFPVTILLEEKILAAGLYGVLNGLGTGLVLRVGHCSFGGTDTIGKILKKVFFPSWDLSTAMTLTNIVILALMLIGFSLDAVAYAVVGYIVTVYFMNYVLFNLGSRLYEVQIISEKWQELEDFAVNELNRTLTIYTVTGAYSDEEKTEVDCVCTSKEYVKLRDFLLNLDQNCFVKVFPLVNVFGKSRDFKKLDDEIL